MKVAQAEAELYEELWAGKYTEAPTQGLRYVPVLLDLVGSERGTLLDVGCGDGSTGVELAKQGFRVVLTDLVNAQDTDLPFYQQPMWAPLPLRGTLGGRYDVVTSFDVLEHLPPEYTMLAVDQMLRVGRRVFLTISLVPDIMGQWVGKPLHQTVQPFTWWRDRLASLGTVLEARDLITTGLYWIKP